MDQNHIKYQKIKKKYLKFLSSQEVMSEPFRDKLGQLNKFYLPISRMIKEEYLREKKRGGGLSAKTCETFETIARAQTHTCNTEDLLLPCLYSQKTKPSMASKKTWRPL